MALYAIGDLHLSMSSDKPMDVFGARWENHIEKLREGFSALTEDDVCVLCGDLSWGMSIDDCLDDFRFIASLPGKKIVLKGNHDYWWTTRAKAERFFAENGIEGIEILNNNCVMYDEKTAICGTRGWFYEEETGAAHDQKIMEREIGRLETSRKSSAFCIILLYSAIIYAVRYSTCSRPTACAAAFTGIYTAWATNSPSRD